MVLMYTHDVSPPLFSPTQGRAVSDTRRPWSAPSLIIGCGRTMTSSSPKLLPPTSGPRLIVYHQTIHDPQGNCNSLLPLLTNNTGVTHVIVAAIHLNDGPGNITLNDHRPDDKRFDQLWGEVSWLQGSGVKVLGMLGGAAKGTFERLGGDDESVRTVDGVLPCILTWSSLKHITFRSTP
jgi:hypothetical protein